MKKKIVLGLCLVLLLCSSIALAETSVSRLFVNGQKLDADVTFIEGRSYVPARDVFEAIGGSVTWDEESNAVHVTYPAAPTADLTPLQKQIEEYMRKHVANKSFSGNILVSIGGEIVVEQSYGMANYELDVVNDETKVFLLASLTKPIIATTILMLEEQGLLSKEDTVARFIPEFAHGEVVTIHHLLNHTSGIQDFTLLPEYQSMKTRPHSTQQLIAMSSDRPLLFNPGENYQYNNSGYILLAAIIEVVSEQPWDLFLSNHVFEPLGMTSTRVSTNTSLTPNRASRHIYDYQNERYNLAPYEDASVVHAAGGIMSTARDLLLWERSIAEGSLLTQQTQEKAYVPNQANYGYGWFVQPLFGRSRIYHSGTMPGASAFMSRFLNDDVTIITLSNSTPCPIMKINNDIAAMVFDEPYTPPKERVEVPIELTVLARYVGTYVLGPNVAQIYLEDNKLYYTTGFWTSQLVPMSDTEFFFRAGATDMFFRVNEDGSTDEFVNAYGMVYRRQ